MEDMKVHEQLDYGIRNKYVYYNIYKRKFKIKGIYFKNRVVRQI